MTLSGASGPSTFDAAADSSGRLHLAVPQGGAEIPGAVGSAAVIGVPGVPPWGGSTTVTIRAR